MSDCKLHDLLTTCQFDQVFWIYRTNDYDQNILLAKGTKGQMLCDDEVSFELIEHINDPVEYWTIRKDGAMFVRLALNDKAEDLWTKDYVEKWDRFNPKGRPYLYSAEMDDFANTIHGSSKYLHPYGDPLEVHHYEAEQEDEG